MDIWALDSTGAGLLADEDFQDKDLRATLEESFQKERNSFR
jgi:hypothetical protein